jgi:hypothetical protein
MASLGLGSANRFPSLKYSDHVDNFQTPSVKLAAMAGVVERLIDADEIMIEGVKRHRVCVILPSSWKARPLVPSSGAGSS